MTRDQKIANLCDPRRYVPLISPSRPRDISLLREALGTLANALVLKCIRNQDAITIKRDLSRVIEHAYDDYRNGYYKHADNAERNAFIEVSQALDGLYMSSLPNIKSAPKKIASARRALQFNGNPSIPRILDEIQAISDVVSPLASALLDLSKQVQIIKRGEGPKTPPAPANPDQIRGQCACCFRDVAVSGLDAYKGSDQTTLTSASINKDSLSMAHHGYERPGGGWQTQSCSGVDFPPYEVSKAGTQHMLDRALARVAREEKNLRNAPSLTELPYSRRNGDAYVQVRVGREDPLWERAFAHHIQGVKAALGQATSDAKFFEQKVSDWRYTGRLRFASGKAFIIPDPEPGPSNDEIKTYTEGMCHAMAIAFSRKCGFSVIVVESPDDFEGDGGGLCVLHVYAVDDETETAYDIRGARPVEHIGQDAEDFFSSEAYATTYVDEDELRRDYMSSDKSERPLRAITEDDVAEAGRVIDRLYPELVINCTKKEFKTLKTPDVSP